MNYAAARLEDRLGASEPPYRSRGEAQVGRLLDRNGIPFFYEQPVLVYDRGRYRVWQPDFTLPCDNDLIVEYAGMMDVPGYATGIRHKQAVYAANGLPALFVYPEDLKGPHWSTTLRGRIADAGAEALRSAQRASGHIQPSQQLDRRRR